LRRRRWAESVRIFIAVIIEVVVIVRRGRVGNAPFRPYDSFLQVGATRSGDATRSN
jgi:hypothetical protein